ncbi:hypothetical protein AAUPMC_08632, partial [Pasteurella multocida subsp. multocida str. Anand1_cattle]
HGFSAQEFQQEKARLVQLNEKQRSLKAGSLKIADDLVISAANQQVVISQQDRYRLNQRFFARNPFRRTESGISTPHCYSSQTPVSYSTLSRDTIDVNGK